MISEGGWSLNIFPLLKCRKTAISMRSTMKKIFFQIILIFFIVLANRNNLIATDGASEQGITQDDFLEFAKNWFQTISNGCEIDKQAEFFMFKDYSRIFLSQTGQALNLQQHHKFHEKLKNEKFDINHTSIKLKKISDNPIRVRFSCIMSWTAEYCNSGEPIAVTSGEDWVLQRDQKGNIKFVMLMNKYHTLKAGSSQLPKIPSLQKTKAEGLM
jgi:hypothetical protein